MLGDDETETGGYGPALGSYVTLDTPKRICHGRRGLVVSLHLATNEATVQLSTRTQHLVPWDAAVVRGDLPHGTRGRYQRGCHCMECTDASARYMRTYRARA